MLKLFEKVSRASLQTDPREGGGSKVQVSPALAFRWLNFSLGMKALAGSKKAGMRWGLGSSKHQREKLAYVGLVLAYVGFPKAPRG